MMTRLTLTALALTLAALPALGQETTTDSAPAAAAAPEVSMGIPEMPDAATAQPGQLYLASKSEAWEKRCIKATEGKDPCQLYQLLMGADGNPVAEVSFFTLPEGGQAVAGATIVVPLETLLTANIRVGVDATQGKLYPYSYCNINGCIAKVGFTAEEIKAMQSGNQSIITIVPAAAPKETVKIAISLKGFTAGLDSLSQ
ncbi:invasion associated locus B family protein [Stagnihabitans tardus]|uniref:Invasion associated locus B family protein n=1 Tax=Stagnihabitans tardus TaxID=2699202 RepID=A0AAE4Y8J9_9RHOB|nr:invasion associated locus B family protein [Stagnihabitans tardus]NBZ87957.1 invasion associated locus B family protein [Stagnihabitans tardus]